MIEFAIACQVRTPIGVVYIAPNGRAMATWRVGERRNGEMVATVDMSDAEIERAGLSGVLPGTREANRLYP